MNETRDRHVCSNCGKHFVVVYRQLDSDEPFRPVRLGCPHCTAVNRVSVGRTAAGASAYRVEKMEPSV